MARILLLGGDRETDAFRNIVLDGHDVARTVEGDASFDLVVDLENDGYGEDYPPGSIVIASVLTRTATEAAEFSGHGSLLGIAFLPGVSERAASIEISAPISASGDILERGKALLSEVTGREVEIVEDRVALVSARILAMVINEAAFALMEGVADASDIDTAMKLGTNYPNGPLAWVDTIGAATIVDILDALQFEYGEERYRPAALLRQHARARKPFHRAEGT